MIVNSLKIDGFRNFETAAAEFGNGTNVMYGSNGSGKTNLVEGVFLACLGRSHRGASDMVMLRENAQTYRVEATISGNDGHHESAVAYEREGRKKITLDKVKARASELFEHHRAVACGPEDTVILNGPPAARRTFIDTYLSQLSQRYLNALMDYQRALAQKNAALKSNGEINPFNSLLIPLGGEISFMRQDFLRTLLESAARFSEEIAPGGGLHLEYQSSAAPRLKADSAEDFANSFELRLRDYADRERMLQTSVVGPHRDEIMFKIRNLPARTHASQGETRTAAIALKLAVYEILKGRSDIVPVLLLDEVFAELDARRCVSLIKSFADFGQVFLTTAQEPPEELAARATLLKIENGRVEREN